MNAVSIVLAGSLLQLEQPLAALGGAALLLFALLFAVRVGARGGGMRSASAKRTRALPRSRNRAWS